ncbi:MAG TPA: branched-chain amino acid ABC transporter permease [Solirubrobacteraceae bacterium]|nr:branched-chain amino acid ABC transporter permease [Solirubrobacteraceae bacterium]
MTTLLTVVLFGIYAGALLSIGSVGFSMQFGITNVLNLAYGAVLTAGMFSDYWIGGGSSSVWLAIVLGAVGGAVISLILGRGIVASYVKRGTTLFGMAMVTIALGLVMQFGLQAIQGPADYSYAVSHTTVVHIGSVAMSTLQLIVIGCAVVLMLAIHALLRYTTLGLAMRSTAADASLARACGVPTTRIRNVAWIISGALCGISGALLGLSTGSFNSTTGGGFFITLVAAAIIGGVGKPYGAMLGALIVGIASEAAAALIDPSYKDIVAWVILILVLLLRPQGIFAEFASERELVA